MSLRDASILPIQNEEERLNELIEQLSRVADGELGTTQKERDYAAKFRPFGRKALPLLLPHLTDLSAPNRKLVNEILKGLPGIDDRELPRLFEAYQRGNHGAVFVVSAIGSPKAMAFLKEQLQDGRGDSDYTFEACARLGARFIPSLLALYRDSVDSDLWENLESLFGRLQSSAYRFKTPHLERVGSEAVKPLLAMARDKSLPVAKRCSVIRSLGTLGEAAQKVARDLLVLGQQPALSATIDSALLAMKAPEAVDSLRRQLRSEKQTDVYLLRSIANMERQGQGAGAEVAILLNSADWELRWAAARTLGYIGYQRAIPDLIAQLKNEEDWRVVWASAESLGRLGAREARTELQRIANNHWFAPVRDTAQRALANTPYPSAESQWEFFSYGDLGRFTPPKPPADRLRASLEVEQGKLIGSDNGEWGGKLEFVGAQGSRQVLLSKNTKVICRVGKQLVALCGRAHLSLNDGAAYRVEETKPGQWRALPWRILPGAPRWARLLSPTQLEITCYSGQVLLSDDGSLRSVS